MSTFKLDETDITAIQEVFNVIYTGYTALATDEQLLRTLELLNATLKVVECILGYDIAEWALNRDIASIQGILAGRGILR